ncbi:MAG: DMT family transporter [Bdellovibrionaceae bacterium]|nr:DMT family transporter [Pseudobdellovibrionaceae bacterium]
MITSTRRLGFLQVALSGVFFGSLSLFGKTAFEAGVLPGEFLALRFLGAGILLFLWILLTGGKLRLSAKHIAICAGLGIVGYALFSFLFFRSLVDLSSALSVLLLYQYPWIVAVAASLFLGEKIQPRQWLLFPLLVVGLGLVIGFDYEMRSPVGLLYGFGAAVFYSVYILLARFSLKSVPALSAVAWIQLFAGLVLFAIHFRSEERVVEVMTVSAWPLALTIVFPTVLAMSLFISGLQKLKSWEVSIVSTLEPLTTIVLGAWFLRESLAPLQSLGCVVLMLAMLGLALTERSAPKISG